jgi:hypothetical protein
MGTLGGGWRVIGTVSGLVALVAGPGDLRAGEPGGFVVESAQGDLVQGLLTVRGPELGSEAPQVLLGDVELSVTEFSPTILRAALPPAPLPEATAGAGRLSVTKVEVDAAAGTVTIRGPGFGTEPPEAVLGTTRLTLLSTSSTALVAELPAGLLPGTHRLTLRRASGRGQARFVVAVGSGQPSLAAIEDLEGAGCSLSGQPGTLQVGTGPGGQVVFSCQPLPSPSAASRATGIGGPPPLTGPAINSAQVDPGAGTLTIGGTGFGPEAPLVALGGADLAVLSVAPATVVASLPASLLPGSHLLTLRRPSSRGETSFVVVVGTGGPALASTDALAGLACNRDGFAGNLQVAFGPGGALALQCDYCFQALQPGTATTVEAVSLVADQVGTVVIVPEVCGPANPTVGCVPGPGGGGQLSVSVGTIAALPTGDPNRFTFSVPVGVSTVAPIPISYDPGIGGIINCSVTVDTAAGPSPTVTVTGEALFGSQVSGSG